MQLRLMCEVTDSVHNTIIFVCAMGPIEEYCGRGCLYWVVGIFLDDSPSLTLTTTLYLDCSSSLPIPLSFMLSFVSHSQTLNRSQHIHRTCRMIAASIAG